MGRAPCCDKANVKRGPWSPEEDTALKTYLHRHGTGGNWIALPHKAGLKRCGKSCRLRWLNYLRPDIKHGGFTEEEDNIICTLYKNIGSRWSVIASHLPGRTDNDVKNYWNTKLKKKLLAGKTNPSNNLTTNSNSPIKISSSSSSSHVSVPKTETLCYSFSTLSSEISSLLLPPLESGFDFTMSSLQKLLQEPIQFPPQTSIDVFSSQMDSSVSNSNASFSSPLPQGSSFNAEFESCLMDFNHGSAAEAFGEYGFSDKIGEAPAGFANFGFPNLFAAGDNKQQGIYQSVTY